LNQSLSRPKISRYTNRFGKDDLQQDSNFSEEEQGIEINTSQSRSLLLSEKTVPSKVVSLSNDYGMDHNGYMFNKSKDVNELPDDGEKLDEDSKKNEESKRKGSHSRLLHGSSVFVQLSPLRKPKNQPDDSSSGSGESFEVSDEEISLFDLAR
jgi:hypothetical protein